MDYNTDVITSIAKQVAETFKAALTQGRQAEGPAPTIAEVEKDMREMLRQIGAEALSLEAWNAGGGTAVRLWGNVTVSTATPSDRHQRLWEDHVRTGLLCEV